MLKKTSKYFTDLGYNIILGSSNFLRYGPFAGTPQDRAKDIHAMFKNPKVDAIICAWRIWSKQSFTFIRL